MEQEMSQEYNAKVRLKAVSINSVYMNKNWSIDANSQIKDMHMGDNKLTVPYKIDTGSNGNIMPWYIFKKLFPRVTEAELEKSH